MKKALVLSLAVVLGLGVASFAQTLTGYWDTDITIVPTPISLGIDSKLSVTYTVGNWSFSSLTTIDETGWTAQSFDVIGSMFAFTLGSGLVFDPLLVEFDKWTATGGFNFTGVDILLTFTLEPGVTTLLIEADYDGSDVDVSIDINLGSGEGCDFDFAGIDIEVDFPFCCDIDVVSKIVFTCDGFQYVTFDVVGIELPGLPWLTLDASLKFETQTKTLTITPKVDFGIEACLTVIMSQDAEAGTYPSGEGMSIGALAIDGISLVCELGGVSFTGISYWGDGEKPEPLKGDYWEAYQISLTQDSCCGGDFEFDLTIFFLEGGAQLFDIAEIDAYMEIGLTEQFTFSTGIDIILDPLPTSFGWTIGFYVEW